MKQSDNKKQIRARAKKILSWLGILFVALFIFRFIYGYTVTPSNSVAYDNRLFFEQATSVKKNYASKKYEVKNPQATTKVDQKYEKIAEITTKSSKFEKEEKQTRKAIEQYKALIQFEQKSGNIGYRNLNLVIGVPPENFDALYEQLVKIGYVQSKQITKTDKTNEYKELNAKKASLEKMRNALIELKSKGGEIREFMDLETRILEIESQLQELGVSLGDFDVENEFCTVKFTLLEGREVKIGFLHRIKVAFQWTIKWFLGLMVTLAFATMFAYFLALLVEQLKIFERLFRDDTEQVK